MVAPPLGYGFPDTSLSTALRFKLVTLGGAGLLVLPHTLLPSPQPLPSSAAHCWLKEFAGDCSVGCPRLKGGFPSKVGLIVWLFKV